MRVSRLAACALACMTWLPSCTSTANVSDVWMSLDEDGARRRTLFFADSTGIVCAAEAGIGRRNVTVEMRIRQIRELPFGQGGSDFQPIDRVVVAEEFHPGPTTGGAPAILALRMVPSAVDPSTGTAKEDQDAPFPPGTYRCEVLLDGQPVGAAVFNVQYAECPAAVIVPGARCAGFFAIDPPASCPQNGATGNNEPRCSCIEATRGWECGS